MERGRLGARGIVVLGLLGALLVVLQVAMALLPNIEPVSLLVVGNADGPSFPQEVRQYTEERTDLHGGGIKVNFLLNYGWEWDMADLDQPGRKREKICACLHSHDISRIDLVIRWGGMRRLSGFLPVQTVYADFFVVDRLWPDFQPEDFYEALQWYQKQDVTLGG
mgnify:CR=1 FL=1